MSVYEKMPGVYIEEISSGSAPIVGTGTSIATFIGNVPNGTEENKPVFITSWSEFQKNCVKEGADPFAANCYLPYSVYCFFNEGGSQCYVINIGSPSTPSPGGNTPGDDDSEVLKLKDSKAQDCVIVRKKKAFSGDLWLQVLGIGGSVFRMAINTDKDINIYGGYKAYYYIDFNTLPIDYTDMLNDSTNKTVQSGYIWVKRVKGATDIPVRMAQSEKIPNVTKSLPQPSDRPFYDDKGNQSVIILKKEGVDIDLWAKVTTSSPQSFFLYINKSDKVSIFDYIEGYKIDFSKLSTEYTDTMSVLYTPNGQPHSGTSEYIWIKKASGNPDPPQKMSYSVTIPNPPPIVTPKLSVSFYSDSSYKIKSIFVQQQENVSDNLWVKISTVSKDSFTLIVYKDNDNNKAETDIFNFTELPSDKFTKKVGSVESKFIMLKKAFQVAKPPVPDQPLKKLEKIPPPPPPQWITELKKIDNINIISFPDIVSNEVKVYEQYIKYGYEYCYERKFCFLLIDPPKDKKTPNEIKNVIDNTIAKISLTIDDKHVTVKESNLNKYSAIYFPWINISNPAYNPFSVDTKILPYISVPPSGAIAGIYARTDAARGVWKAPAGLDDGRINSAVDVMEKFTEKEYGILNSNNINAIRIIKGTNVCVWGARTVVFSNNADTEWRYINVRRLFNYIEESLYHNTQWVVFEPNGPELWGIVKRNITAFLNDQWKAGAFYGKKPEEAFFVKVDKDNNPLEVREQGELIIEIGIAPIKPAEFIMIKIKQKVPAS